MIKGIKEVKAELCFGFFFDLLSFLAYYNTKLENSTVVLGLAD